MPSGEHQQTNPAAGGIRKRSVWVFASIVYLNLVTFLFGGDLTRGAPRPPDPVSEIPFTLLQGYLVVVEGRLGNLEHQHLLIDTGSNPSLIDQSVSARLGLKGTPRDLSLFNRNLSGESTTLPELRLGPLHRQGLQVMVADLSQISRGIGSHVDAVIGLDVLGASSFTIDYQKRRISFRASLERYSATFKPGQQFISLNLNAGNRELHLLLDTGTPQLILFQRALRDLDYDWTSVGGSGQNISGTVPYRKIILPRARLGTEDVGPQSASVVAGQQNVESDYDGLIGISVLRPKRLSFDFDRQILGWSK